MAQKTSINIKPCNIGSSEAHNRRTTEYLANIGKEKFYIRTELMSENEAWVSPDFGEATLTDRYNQIAAMVKEKTGRAMQTKDRERVNKKTGKVTIVRGSTPLKEGVVVINADTTMEQLRRFCELSNERWGITALQIFIHRDEGHYGTPGDDATWKPNYHAHILWDWMDHETGKSFKLDEKDMSEMQTLLAECLGMERGTSKEETGKEHLERADFIRAKQRQEAEQAKAEKEAALAVKEDAIAAKEKACAATEEALAAKDAAIAAKDAADTERQRLENETKEKEQYRLSLANEIAEKEQQLKGERKAKMDSILDSVGSFVGVDDSPRQLRVEQVIIGRQGEIVVREVINGEYVSDKRQQFPGKGFTLRFRHVVGKLVFHDFAQDGVLGVAKPLQQCVHRQFLRTSSRIAFEHCPFIRSCGTVGAFTDEGFVGRLFKFVRSEIVQQVQTVVGKVGLSFVFLLVVHYFGI